MLNQRFIILFLIGAFLVNALVMLNASAQQIQIGQVTMDPLAEKALACVSAANLSEKIAQKAKQEMCYLGVEVQRVIPISFRYNDNKTVLLINYKADYIADVRCGFKGEQSYLAQVEVDAKGTCTFKKADKFTIK